MNTWKMDEDTATYMGLFFGFQVSIDHKTRQVIENEIAQQPTQFTFDKAQQHVYYVMFQDCYPRFLVSALMKELLNGNQ